MALKQSPGGGGSGSWYSEWLKRSNQVSRRKRKKIEIPSYMKEKVTEEEYARRTQYKPWAPKKPAAKPPSSETRALPAHVTQQTSQRTESTYEKYGKQRPVKAGMLPFSVLRFNIRGELEDIFEDVKKAITHPIANVVSPALKGLTEHVESMFEERPKALKVVKAVESGADEETVMRVVREYDRLKLEEQHELKKYMKGRDIGPAMFAYGIGEGIGSVLETIGFVALAGVGAAAAAGAVGVSGPVGASAAAAAGYAAAAGVSAAYGAQRYADNILEAYRAKRKLTDPMTIHTARTSGAIEAGVELASTVVQALRFGKQAKVAKASAGIAGEISSETLERAAQRTVRKNLTQTGVNVIVNARNALVKKTLADAASEGLEESIQEISGNLLDEYQRRRTIKDASLDELIRNTVTAGIIGAISGGVGNVVIDIAQVGRIASSLKALDDDAYVKAKQAGMEYKKAKPADIIRAAARTYAYVIDKGVESIHDVAPEVYEGLGFNPQDAVRARMDALMRRTGATPLEESVQRGAEQQVQQQTQQQTEQQTQQREQQVQEEAAVQPVRRSAPFRKARATHEVTLYLAEGGYTQVPPVVNGQTLEVPEIEPGQPDVFASAKTQDIYHVEVGDRVVIATPVASFTHDGVEFIVVQKGGTFVVANSVTGEVYDSETSAPTAFHAREKFENLAANDPAFQSRVSFGQTVRRVARTGKISPKYNLQAFTDIANAVIEAAQQYRKLRSAQQVSPQQVTEEQAPELPGGETEGEFVVGSMQTSRGRFLRDAVASTFEASAGGAKVPIRQLISVLCGKEPGGIIVFRGAGRALSSVIKNARRRAAGSGVTPRNRQAFLMLVYDPKEATLTIGEAEPVVRRYRRGGEERTSVYYRIVEKNSQTLRVDAATNEAITRTRRTDKPLIMVTNITEPFIGIAHVGREPFTEDELDNAFNWDETNLIVSLTGGDKVHDDALFITRDRRVHGGYIELLGLGKVAQRQLKDGLIKTPRKVYGKTGISGAIRSRQMATERAVQLGRVASYRTADPHEREEHNAGLVRRMMDALRRSQGDAAALSAAQGGANGRRAEGWMRGALRMARLRLPTIGVISTVERARRLRQRITIADIIEEMNNVTNGLLSVNKILTTAVRTGISKNSAIFGAMKPSDVGQTGGPTTAPADVAAGLEGVDFDDIIFDMAGLGRGYTRDDTRAYIALFVNTIDTLGHEYGHWVLRYLRDRAPAEFLRYARSLNRLFRIQFVEFLRSNSLLAHSEGALSYIERGTSGGRVEFNEETAVHFFSMCLIMPEEMRQRFRRQYDALMALVGRDVFISQGFARIQDLMSRYYADPDFTVNMAADLIYMFAERRAPLLTRIFNRFMSWFVDDAHMLMSIDRIEGYDLRNAENNVYDLYHISRLAPSMADGSLNESPTIVMWSSNGTVDRSRVLSAPTEEEMKEYDRLTHDERVERGWLPFKQTRGLSHIIAEALRTFSGRNRRTAVERLSTLLLAKDLREKYLVNYVTAIIRILVRAEAEARGISEARALRSVLVTFFDYDLDNLGYVERAAEAEPLDRQLRLATPEGLRDIIGLTPQDFESLPYATRMWLRLAYLAHTFAHASGRVAQELVSAYEAAGRNIEEIDGSVISDYAAQMRNLGIQGFLGPLARQYPPQAYLALWQVGAPLLQLIEDPKELQQVMERVVTNFHEGTFTNRDAWDDYQNWSPVNFFQPLGEYEVRRVLRESRQFFRDNGVPIDEIEEELVNYVNNKLFEQKMNGLVSEHYYNMSTGVYREHIGLHMRDHRTGRYLVNDLLHVTTLEHFVHSATGEYENAISSLLRLEFVTKKMSVKKAFLHRLVTKASQNPTRYRQYISILFDDDLEKYDQGGMWSDELPEALHSLRMGHPQVLTLENDEFIYFDGRYAYWFRVEDKALAQLLLGEFSPEALDALFKPMNIFARGARFFKTFVTASPFWVVGNKLIDIQTQLFGTKMGSYPGLSELRTSLHATTGRREWREYSSLGLTNFSLVRQDMDPESAAYVRRLLSTRTYAEWLEVLERMPERVFNAFITASSFFESTARYEEFWRALQNGHSLETAIRLSQEITVNFYRGGSVARFINKYVPFYNPAIQVIYRTIKAYQEIFTPNRGWSKYQRINAFMLFLALVAAVVYLNHPRNRDRWKQIGEEERTKYVPIFAPDGSVMRIPVSDAVEPLWILVLTLFDRYKPDDLETYGYLDVSTRNRLKRFIPVAFGGSVIEAYINRDIYRNKPIVPLRLENLPTEEQYDEQTTELAKYIGRKLGVSPMKVDYVLQNTTGTLIWQDFVRSMDLYAISPLVGARKEGLPQGVYRFYKEDTFGFSSASVRAFYNEAEDIKGKYLAFRKRVKYAFSLTPPEQLAEGKVSDETREELLKAIEYAKENEADIIDYRLVYTVTDELSKLGREIERINRSNLPATEKRRERTKVKMRITKLSEQAIQFRRGRYVVLYDMLLDEDQKVRIIEPYVVEAGKWYYPLIEDIYRDMVSEQRDISTIEVRW